MKRPISRRSLLGVAPLALAGCSRSGDYFGLTEPRRRQRLVYQIGAEPETLDPAHSQSGSENYILPSLFEGLVTLDPRTEEPLAGIATHYQSDSGHTQFTFYLRGHPQPRGIVLPKAVGNLPRSRRSLDRLPARWSDGALLTAHDFVYSWRRVVDLSLIHI